MRRYYIAVPKDKKADDDFDYDRAKPEQLIEWILGSDEYKLLDEANVFYDINDTCNVMIDEYEEDWLNTSEKLTKCIDLLGKIKAGGQLQKLVNKLLNMVREAKNRDTGIYFYF